MSDWEIRAPLLPREITRDIHEHEALLNFATDSQADSFRDWWFSAGLDAWREWYRRQAEGR